MKLSIVAPVYNEQENIGKIIEELQRIKDKIKDNFQILVVNDHSCDNTVKIVEGLSLRYSNIKLIHNDGKKGLGFALRRGFKEITKGALVVVMGDFADRITDIPVMYNKIEFGWDVVCGSRYCVGGKANHHNKLKGFFSDFLGLALNKIIKLPTRDAANAFKMFTYEVLTKIMPIESGRFTTGLEVVIKAYKKGFKITEVPTVWQDRALGKSSFKIVKTMPDYLKWFLYALYIRGQKTAPFRVRLPAGRQG